LLTILEADRLVRRERLTLVKTLPSNDPAADDRRRYLGVSITMGRRTLRAGYHNNLPPTTCHSFPVCDCAVPTAALALIEKIPGQATGMADRRAKSAPWTSLDCSTKFTLLLADETASMHRWDRTPQIGRHISSTWWRRKRRAAQKNPEQYRPDRAGGHTDDFVTEEAFKDISPNHRLNR
jgi:hypothetical protein